MKTFYSKIFLIVILSFCSGYVNAIVTKEPTNRLDKFCNMFLTSVCFGINNRNSVSLTIPADYLLYKVSFDNDLIATIYEGFWPNLENEILSSKYKKCSETKKICAYFVDRNGSIEAIYRRNIYEDSIHIVIHNISNENHIQALEFLNSFKSCRNTKLSRICNKNSIFSK